MFVHEPSSILSGVESWKFWDFPTLDEDSMVFRVIEKHFPLLLSFVNVSPINVISLVISCVSPKLCLKLSNPCDLGIQKDSFENTIKWINYSKALNHPKVKTLYFYVLSGESTNLISIHKPGCSGMPLCIYHTSPIPCNILACCYRSKHQRICNPLFLYIFSCKIHSLGTYLYCRLTYYHYNCTWNIAK